MAPLPSYKNYFDKVVENLSLIFVYTYSLIISYVHIHDDTKFLSLLFYVASISWRYFKWVNYYFYYFYFLRNSFFKTLTTMCLLAKLSVSVKVCAVALGSAAVIGLIVYYRHRHKNQKKPKTIPTK